MKILVDLPKLVETAPCHTLEEDNLIINIDGVEVVLYILNANQSGDLLLCQVLNSLYKQSPIFAVFHLAQLDGKGMEFFGLND